MDKATDKSTLAYNNTGSNDEKEKQKDLAMQDPKHWIDPLEAERAKYQGVQEPLLQPPKKEDLRTGKPEIHEVTGHGCENAS